MRLWLIGDDEALDILAELSRHLDYFQVARLDRLEEIDDLTDLGGVLGPSDHVVSTRSDERRTASAGLAVLLASPATDSAGARAIVAASALVEALRAKRAPTGA